MLGAVRENPLGDGVVLFDLGGVPGFGGQVGSGRSRPSPDIGPLVQHPWVSLERVVELQVGQVGPQL